MSEAPSVVPTAAPTLRLRGVGRRFGGLVAVSGVDLDVGHGARHAILGPNGAGKTTTIVESVAHRVEHRGLDPERVLVLTFSRKAAGELRDRITARMRRTTRTPLALNVKIDEAQSHGQTIFEYAPKSKGAELLAEIAEELFDAGVAVRARPLASAS